jgi:hypothetical protein
MEVKEPYPDIFWESSFQFIEELCQRSSAVDIDPVNGKILSDHAELRCSFFYKLIASETIVSIERLLSPPLIPGIAQYVHLLSHPSLILRYLVIFDDEEVCLFALILREAALCPDHSRPVFALAQKSTDGISLIRSSEYCSQGILRRRSFSACPLF